MVRCLHVIMMLVTGTHGCFIYLFCNSTYVIVSVLNVFLSPISKSTIVHVSVLAAFSFLTFIGWVGDSV